MLVVHMCFVWSVLIGVNYRYDETLVVPIIENTPEEHELKVSIRSKIAYVLSYVVNEYENGIYQENLRSRQIHERPTNLRTDTHLLAMIPRHDQHDNRFSTGLH